MRSGRLSIGLACLAILAGCAFPNPQVTEVRTSSGVVSGSIHESVISWKGIPFAAPPVGSLRWRAPQPPAPWQGVRATTHYAHDCMQLLFPSDAAPLGTSPDEDCLYVNVWRPQTAASNLPVIFWIYGGGGVNGGSSPPTYSGAELARKGVVVVSANYRLGRFGTFAHPQLTAANADSGLLGNFALLDQIAALEWVRTNVAEFGGDPGNVTIIGESAGGFSVHALMVSPMARGLFARAVIMSGGDGSSCPCTLRDAERAGLSFAASQGIAADDPDALVSLRALDQDRVTDGLNIDTMDRQFEAGTLIPTFTDGTIMVDLARAYAAEEFAKVPVMIGATSDDIGGPDGFMVAGARAVARTLSAKGVPVFGYRFSYVAEGLEPGNGALHATDIPFFFDTQAIKYGPATTPRDNAMGAAISAYLVNFVRTGEPNDAGLPAWPRYSSSSDEIMDFAADGTARPGKDPRGAEIDQVQAKAGG